jgi:hypothetical protein
MLERDAGDDCGILGAAIRVAICSMIAKENFTESAVGEERSRA